MFQDAIAHSSPRWHGVKESSTNGIASKQAASPAIIVHTVAPTTVYLKYGCVKLQTLDVALQLLLINEAKHAVAKRIISVCASAQAFKRGVIRF